MANHLSRARGNGRGTRRAAAARAASAAFAGFLTVGRTARILGVSPSTLRLWEHAGLVTPTRSNGRYRLYSPDLLQVLKRIKYLREVEQLNVPAIKQALAAAPAAGEPERSNGYRPSPLGPKLRRMRQRQRLGIADAARRAGVSPGFLSAIERSHANASVATLQRLASTYGTTVLELFDLPRQPNRLVRPRDRQVLTTHPGVRMELLSTGAPMLQSMLFRVAPRAGSEGAYSHEGEEFIYMLSGTLEIWLDELECFTLTAGDSLWFASTHGHHWLNPSADEEAVLLWINTPPTF